MKCFELTDDIWGRLEAVLKSDKSTWRGKSENKRLFVEGVLSLLKDKKEFSTSLNWKNLNPKYGNSLSQCRTFNRWRDNGVWEKLLPVFASRAKYSWVAKLGTYEVLLKNGKYLLAINKAIQDIHMQEQHKIKKDIDFIKLENEQLQQEIIKKSNMVNELSQKIKYYTEGDFTNEVIQQKNMKINNLTRSIRFYRGEIKQLKEFNKQYIKILYNKCGYTPHGKGVSSSFRRNFWSVASALRDEKERLKEKERQKNINTQF